MAKIPLESDVLEVLKRGRPWPTGVDLDRPTERRKFRRKNAKIRAKNQYFICSTVKIRPKTIKCT